MNLRSFSFKSLVLTSVAWWCCWIILQTLVLWQTFGVAWLLALQDAIITNTLIAFSGYIMVTVLRFYQPRQSLRLVYSIGISLICAFMIEGVAELAAANITGNDAYRDFLERSIPIRGIFAWLLISLMSTMSWLWFYVREQQENEARKADTENLAREAELAKLRQQLQPHFLFNSLNSISALAGSKPEQARKMIQQLSDFLRGTLKKDDQQLVPLSEELQHLQLYLEIEKVRFGHRLKTQVDHDEASAAMKLPSLLLQPIVENAIKFGLYDTIGEIVITLSARAEDHYLVVSVTNPYDAATSQPRQGTGFGLTSVQRRLYLLFARHDLLVTEKNDVLFTTTVKIPQHL